MLFRFVKTPRNDSPDTVEIDAAVNDCSLCSGSHTTGLYPLDPPVRIKPSHTTYSFFIECPIKRRYVLIEDWKASPVNIWVAAGPPEELVPHIEGKAPNLPPIDDDAEGAEGTAERWPKE